jgi:hypothetical protein
MQYCFDKTSIRNETWEVVRGSRGGDLKWIVGLELASLEEEWNWLRAMSNSGRLC